MAGPAPTARELDALKVLWDAADATRSAPSAGGATVREVVERMNENGERLAYTTVLSLLQVMEQKGFVRHVQVGKAYVYHPRVARDKTLRRMAGGFLEQVFDGAIHEYLVHAIDGRKLSNEELDDLEEMIADMRKRQQSNKPTRQRHKRRESKDG